ncbi:NAD(+)--dinitrogen-reductase ADP-D-ribosyltransferase [Thiocapsa sp.]|uniref:NAD(+)--dinitrogen-reductase ADP-D-ribosyltransferase n=1 Tax=Thiocapsa sp. TaxID=2024551 RepID=UPI0034577C54
MEASSVSTSKRPFGGGPNHLLFDNLNSYTSSRERADEFGDYILIADVSLPKIFFNQLLPGLLKGEDEFVVIGGCMRFRLVRFEAGACAGFGTGAWDGGGC